VRENKLKIDYSHYITNQIMKPVLQLYALVLEDLDGYRLGKHYYENMYKKLLVEKKGDVIKARTRWNDLREADVKKILFDPILHKLTNKKQKNQEITNFFGKKG